jgi:hypothetical protein
MKGNSFVDALVFFYLAVAFPFPYSIQAQQDGEVVVLASKVEIQASLCI